MTHKDKELLLKDLCARLPYGVKISKVIEDSVSEPRPIRSINLNNIIVEDGEFEDGTPDIDVWNYEDIKPYLFPLSSMTEKQKREYNFWKHEVPVCHYEYGDVVEEIELYDSPESVEYLIENNFDYRGLIPKGIALDATGLNIY